MDTIINSLTKTELVTYAKKIGGKNCSSLTKREIITYIRDVLKNSSGSKNKKPSVVPPSSSLPTLSTKRVSASTIHSQKQPIIKPNKVPQFEIISILGKGKEGVAYKVKKENSNTVFAMKQFKKNKSVIRFHEEIKLQNIAAKANIAPNIVYVNEDEKYFVMDKLDNHLYDYLCKTEGNLPKQYQVQIINLFKTLDQIGVFHADANLMNYMFKGKNLMLIDYGMAKPINTSLINKLKTKTPNLEYMTIGIILKLKELNCNPSSWAFFLNYVSPDKIESLNLLNKPDYDKIDHTEDVSEKRVVEKHSHLKKDKQPQTHTELDNEVIDTHLEATPTHKTYDHPLFKILAAK